MASTTTFLITGATRGIGRGLVSAYLSSPGNTVIASVRDVLHPNAQSLKDVPTGPGSSLIIIQMDTSSSSSVATAIQELTNSHGIQSLDVVIANAGINKLASTLVGMPLSHIQEHIDVNAYGPLHLFNAVLPLLRKSPAAPRFVTISSESGSLANINVALPMAAYGASKALSNFFTRWLALENPDIIIWSLHPGVVATDLAEIGFAVLEKEKGLDLRHMATSVEEMSRIIKSVIDSATMEKTSGHFLAYDGQELPW